MDFPRDVGMYRGPKIGFLLTRLCQGNKCSFYVYPTFIVTLHSHMYIAYRTWLYVREPVNKSDDIGHVYSAIC